jgi:hypothetical protein
MKLVWKIALGIILATAILSAGGLAVTASLAWWGNEQLEQHLAQQRERLAKREQAAAVAKRLAAENQRKAALEERQAKEATRAQQREQYRLDKAFDDQYQPPPSCLNPSSDIRWVECVDLRRSAKAGFMEQRR